MYSIFQKREDKISLFIENNIIFNFWLKKKLVFDNEIIAQQKRLLNIYLTLFIK